MSAPKKRFRDHLSDESRLVRFYDYWTSLKATRSLPKATEFDPAAVADLLPSSAIVEPRQGRYFVAKVGAEMAARIGSDASGLYLDQHATGRFLAFMEGVYRTVCETGRPVLSQTLYGVGRWNEVKLRRLSLPFAGADGKVARIVSPVVFTWRADAEPLVVDLAAEAPAQHKVEAIGGRR